MKITRTVFALTLAALAVLSGCESAKAGGGAEPVVSTRAGKLGGSVTKTLFSAMISLWNTRMH